MLVFVHNLIQLYKTLPKNKKYYKSKSDNTRLPLNCLYIADYTCYLHADNVKNQFFTILHKSKKRAQFPELASVGLLSYQLKRHAVHM